MAILHILTFLLMKTNDHLNCLHALSYLMSKFL